MEQNSIGPRADAIARLLGWQSHEQSNWASERDSRAEWLTPEGMTVFAASGGWAAPAGKVHVWFRYPTSARGGYFEPSKYGPDAANNPDTSINLSLSKSDEQIAREIKRRLIDPAMPVWLAQLERARQSDAYHDGAYTTACTIARAFGLRAPARTERHGDKPASEFRLELDQQIPAIGYGGVRVTGSGISIDVRDIKDPAVAIAVLRALETLIPAAVTE